MRTPLLVSLASLLVLTPACKANKRDDDAQPDEPAGKREKPEMPTNDEVLEQRGPATLGQWVGTIELASGGATLEWAVSITPSEDGDEAAEAKLWIPKQMVTGMSLGPPGVDEDGSMQVRLAPVDAVWTIVPGAEPTCRFSQKGAAFDCTITSTSIDDFAKLADPPRPQTPKPPFPYAVEQLEIPNSAASDPGGVTLSATLTIPEGEGPHPVAVLISGSGLQDRDETIANHKPFWVIADYLSRRGVAVLRYDDRGFGKSTGDGAKATLEDFAGDTWAAVQAVAARPELDGERVGLIGHSEGGVIAPLVAREHPEAIDFVVMLAGTGVTGTEIIVRQLGLIMQVSGADPAEIETRQAEARALHAAVLEHSAEDAPAALDAIIRASFAQLTDEDKRAVGDLDKAVAAQIEALNSPWFRHFLAWDPAPVLAQVEVPVLYMVGDNDLQVDHEQNLPAVRAALADNPKAELVLLPGLNHLFQPASTGSPDEYVTIETTIDEAALAQLATWIRTTTGLLDPADDGVLPVEEEQ